MGTGGSSSGAKWVGREADHSTPSRAEARNGGVIPPFPHNVFMVWCLINYSQGLKTISTNQTNFVNNFLTTYLPTGT
jgi:hypothetical protein